MFGLKKKKAAEETAKKETVKEPVKKEEKPVEKPVKKAEKPVKEAAPAPVEEKAPSKVKGAFEIKRAADGRYMFNLRAGNTQIIASSQMYSSLSACKNGIASVANNSAVAPIEDQTLSTINEEKCPKFTISYDKAGKYRFKLIATNGQVVLSSSQGYAQKTGCKTGIASVVTNASAPTVFAEQE